MKPLGKYGSTGLILYPIIICILLFAINAKASDLGGPDQSTEKSTEESVLVRSFIDSAKSMIGLRYVFGGESKDFGVDCSGLVRIAFRESTGLDLPRTARGISTIGQRLKKSTLMAALGETKQSAPESKLAPGDLVFFNTMKKSFSHVGIYLGENEFLHAPRTGQDVRVERLDKEYWASRFNGARRIVGQQDDTLSVMNGSGIYHVANTGLMEAVKIDPKKSAPKKSVNPPTEMRKKMKKRTNE